MVCNKHLLCEFHQFFSYRAEFWIFHSRRKHYSFDSIVLVMSTFLFFSLPIGFQSQNLKETDTWQQICSLFTCIHICGINMLFNHWCLLYTVFFLSNSSLRSIFHGINGTHWVHTESHVKKVNFYLGDLSEADSFDSKKTAKGKSRHACSSKLFSYSWCFQFRWYHCLFLYVV